MRRVVYWPLVWLFLGFTVILSDAGMKWQKQEKEEKKPDKLICYVCNSLYDERCADPFDPYTLGYVDCSMRLRPDHLNRTLKATLCRKTVQKVSGKIRVSRGCGYYLDAKYDHDCIQRTGTHEVHVTYCACNSSYCNDALPSVHPSISLTFAAPLALYNFLYLG